MSAVHRTLRRASQGFAIAAVGVLVIGGAAVLTGARINTSPSIPVGLYWTTRQPITKGGYVLVCPPNTRPFIQARARGYLDIGHCPGNFGNMMKLVAGMPGDRVSVDSDGVHVNGRLLPDSAPLDRDPQGRLMPRYAKDIYTLAGGELLLMTDSNPLSYDSRYYGPVNASQVRAVIRPIYTWSED